MINALATNGSTMVSADIVRYLSKRPGSADFLSYADLPTSMAKPIKVPLDDTLGNFNSL